MPDFLKLKTRIAVKLKFKTKDKKN